MISILCPSRGRPDLFARMMSSAQETARGEIEFVTRLDDDDPSLDGYLETKTAAHILGPRDVLSKAWNVCWRAAQGDIFMHAGDDILFKTEGWDRIVEDAFPEDRIAFVYGDDLSPHGKIFGTHGFLHRRWTDIVGTFVPPYFSSDFNDTWLNEVAASLDRRIFAPIEIEHMHFSLGKGTLDLTHAERLVRHWKDDNEAIWKNTKAERDEWVRLLREHLK